jgi:Flp pilus assembly protein TadD
MAKHPTAKKRPLALRIRAHWKKCLAWAGGGGTILTCLVTWWTGRCTPSAPPVTAETGKQETSVTQTANPTISVAPVISQTQCQTTIIGMDQQSLERYLEASFATQTKLLRDEFTELKRDSKSPSDNAQANEFLEKGIAAFRDRNLVDAERFLVTSTTLAPGLIAARVGLGEVYLAARRWDEAIREFGRLSEVPGQAAIALSAIGAVHLEKGEYEEAIGFFIRSAQIDTDNRWAHLGRGVALFALEQYVGAEEEAHVLLRANPHDSDALVLLGNVQARTGRHENATSAFQLALSLNPGDQFAHKCYGIARFLAGDLEGAISHTARAIQLDPNDAWPHTSMCLLLGERGEFEQANNECKTAIHIDPGVADAHNNWGVVTVRQGDIPGAIPRFREAVRLAPRYALARRNLGIALSLVKEFHDAEQELREANKLDPRDVNAIISLASVLRDSNRLAEAIRELEGFVESDPRDSRVWLNLGVLYLFDAEPNAAEDALCQAFDLGMRFPGAERIYGSLLLLRGDITNATYWLESACTGDPNDADTRYQLARSYAAAGDYKRARESLDHASSLHPRLAEYAKSDAYFTEAMLPGKLPAPDAPAELRSGRHESSSPEAVQNAIDKVRAKLLTVRDLSVRVRVAVDDQLNLSKQEKSGSFLFAAGNPNPKFLLTFDRTASDGVLGKREWLLFDGRWFSSAVERVRQIDVRELCRPGERIDWFEAGVLPVPFDPFDTTDDLLQRFDVHVSEELGERGSRMTHLVLHPRPMPGRRLNFERAEVWWEEESPLPLRILTVRDSGLVVTQTELGATDPIAVNAGLHDASFNDLEEWKGYAKTVHRFGED